MDDSKKTKRAALYLRVSTDKQTSENQRPEVTMLARTRGLEIVQVYEEIGSAAKHRAEFDRMMVDAHAGRFDVLVVWSLDRFGRSMVGNLQAVLELDRIGVQVVSVRESWLDSSGPTRPLLLVIFGWVAEQERNRMIERTKAGLERARREGKQIGRPKACINLDEALQLRRRGLSLSKAAKKIGIGKSTLHRIYQAFDVTMGIPKPSSLDVNLTHEKSDTCEGSEAA
ncbi:MAG: recombinase family protein [Polyangiaceae bacterium]|nr:recombinase family protein [Polyangiaceae bacterium]